MGSTSSVALNGSWSSSYKRGVGTYHTFDTFCVVLNFDDEAFNVVDAFIYDIIFCAIKQIFFKKCSMALLPIKKTIFLKINLVVKKIMKIIS